MKYILILVTVFVVACREDMPKIANTESFDGVLANHKTDLKKIDIPICKADKKDKELYALFIKSNEMAYANELGGNLYYGSEKESIDILLSGEHISCIVSPTGAGYDIFDIHYNDDFASEIIYDKIINLNLNLNVKLESRDVYFDFLKRGLVFIFNKEQNKLTMVSFNPFVNNDLPNEIKGFFKDDSKFDRVCMIIGLGQVEILVQ